MNPLLPLLIFSLALAGMSHLLAGAHAIPWFGVPRLLGVAAIPAGFLLSLAFILVVRSILNARKHRAPGSDQIDVASLWGSLRPRLNPLTGGAAMLLTGWGISGTGDLNEIYRLTATQWWDAPLWRWEAPLFLALKDSWIDMPEFWDRIYFLCWSYLFLALAAVFHGGNLERFLRLAYATIIAFYLTRALNLAFPTMGPAFLHPDFFELSATASGNVQDHLRLYMAGAIRQHGLLPATMAMPSLHIGLTVMAAWALAGERRWTLWLSVPWVVLIWASTVMLGWHYLLDGVGGILVAAASMAVAGRLVRLAGAVEREVAAAGGPAMPRPENRNALAADPDG